MWALGRWVDVGPGQSHLRHGVAPVHTRYKKLYLTSDYMFTSTDCVVIARIFTD